MTARKRLNDPSQHDKDDVSEKKHRPGENAWSGPPKNNVSITAEMTVETDNLTTETTPTTETTKRVLVLPNDLLVKVLLYAGTLQDLYEASQVSKQFLEATKSGVIWREMAENRFTKRIVDATLGLYHGDHLSMLRDDNERGALPTLNGLWKSIFKHNRSNYFYCCLVTQIQWDRRNRLILLHIDARGEPSLRRPQTSGFFWREDRRDYLRNIDSTVSFHNKKMPGSPAGQFKGFVSVSDEGFHHNGEYNFCYACKVPTWTDYQRTTLFIIAPGESLRDAFDSYALKGESPFDNDTFETELERWRPHVPNDVLRRGWFVR